ncbi:hypothetical protein K437DRAFT_259512 [Tilletiaria anomala UBC 951]|uniref:Uncharacterized protein n=1 Tax=Tilletiaria anomala (strain ATCC 24038 / CBS 436.72 / UBC 951) TaxID=1037660 RepID=A0A066V9H9_TILAU|nr:uncharacterized protein K437DRAFT_259512 [Tilletiaria anomala UBC 951]KDN38146.1 hypothetical protein K437DRAFT_259512 [Tilletiaria anomala UBC 951]
MLEPGRSISAGLVLLQILKAEGASRIVATASGEKMNAVRELGSKAVIDCTPWLFLTVPAYDHGQRNSDRKSALTILCFSPRIGYYSAYAQKWRCR